jgi:hypothetical protein
LKYLTKYVKTALSKIAKKKLMADIQRVKCEKKIISGSMDFSPHHRIQIIFCSFHCEKKLFTKFIENNVAKSVLAIYDFWEFSNVNSRILTSGKSTKNSLKKI